MAPSPNSGSSIRRRAMESCAFCTSSRIATDGVEYRCDPSTVISPPRSTSVVWMSVATAFMSPDGRASKRSDPQPALPDPPGEVGRLLAKHRPVLELEHGQGALARPPLDLLAVPAQGRLLDDLVVDAGLVERRLHPPARVAGQLVEHEGAAVELEGHGMEEWRLDHPIVRRARGAAGGRPPAARPGTLHRRLRAG